MEKKIIPVNRVNIHSLTIRPFLSHLLSLQAVRDSGYSKKDMSIGHLILDIKCHNIDGDISVEPMPPTPPPQIGDFVYV